MATSTAAQLKIVVDAQDRTKGAFASIQGSLQTLGSYARASADASQRLAQVGAVAATGLLGLGLAAVKAGANFEQTQIAFETMLGSAETARKTLNDLTTFAAATPFELPQLEEASKRLLAYGVTAEELIPTLKTLGDVSAGVGMDKLPQLILAFGQVRAATKLTGMELRQFSEAGVPLLGTLAAQLGKTAAEVQEMVSAGEIGFQDVEKALSALTGEGGKFFNLMARQSRSLSGLWSNLQDQISLTARAIGMELLPYLTPVVERLIAMATAIRTLVSNGGMSQFVTVLKENAEFVFVLAGAILGALTPAFIALAAAVASVAVTLAPFALGGALIAGFFAFRDQIEELLTLIDGKTGLITLFRDAWANVVYVFNDQLRPALAELWTTLQPFRPYLEALSVVLGGALVLAIGGIIIILGALAAGIIQTLTWITELATYISGTFIEAWNGVIDQISDVIVWVEKLIQKFQKAIDLASQIGKFVGGAAKGIGKAIGVNDAIIAPNGNIITTHPDDYLIATKDPQSLAGGGMNITITGNTFLDQDSAEKVGDLIMKRLKLSAAL